MVAAPLAPAPPVPRTPVPGPPVPVSLAADLPFGTSEASSQSGDGEQPDSLPPVPLQFLPASGPPHAAGPVAENPVVADPATVSLAVAASRWEGATSPQAQSDDSGDAAAEWTERTAVAAASRFAVERPCPAGNSSRDCEHVDLVLPPARVWSPDPATFIVDLTVRIATARAEPPQKALSGHLSGCASSPGRFQRLVLRVAHGDTGQVVIHLEGEPDDVAEPSSHE